MKRCLVTDRSKDNARLMVEAGSAIYVISNLIKKDLTEKACNDEHTPLSDLEIGGLMSAVMLAGIRIWDSGSDLAELVDREVDA